MFVLLTLSLSGCAGALAPDLPNCGGGTCVRVQLTEPIRLNEPVPVTITVQPQEDILGLKISLATLPTNIPVEGDRQWTADAQAQQTITVRGTVRFIQEGLFYVYGQAYNPRRGGVATDSVRVLLTRVGGTIYLPGTPLPITPGLGPTAVPGFPPTPTRAPYP